VVAFVRAAAGRAGHHDPAHRRSSRA
jgi:hypothetical protein